MSESVLPRALASSPAPDSVIRATGTQALSRALGLLFRIATEGHEGMRLSELADRTQLDSATARRLLICLQHYGFVEQDARSRRYFLGLDFFNLAAAASNRFDLSATIRGALSRLSQHSGETTAYFIRTGNDIVCTDMVRPADAPGPGPVDIGSRRAIGAGAFGMALLAALDTDEGEAIAIDNMRRLSRFPEDDARWIGEQIRLTRRRGYALEHDPAHGTVTLAIAILNRAGVPESVLGVSGSAPGRKARLDQLARMLAGEARHVEDAVWRQPTTRGLGFGPPQVTVSACETPAPP